MSDLKQGAGGRRLSRPERRAARKAARERHRADVRYRAAHRRDPLPHGVRMVYLEHRAAALWVRAPGQAALRTERDGPWQELKIRSVRRCLRPWLVRITLADGTRLTLRPIVPGHAGLADCGHDQGGPEGSTPDDVGGGDDPLTLLLLVLMWLFMLVLLPWSGWNNARRCVHAHRLVRALARRP
ncbi:hypothetical protein [Rhodococcus sp. X156]|uniref:hypothetical protein n=1 Tax=Rhodococcus sp. X156 TaxID=2499145 RepID=UPI000FDC861F|nr:hypothetical protein [Rhodococcus sp. X156]